MLLVDLRQFNQISYIYCISRKCKAGRVYY